MVEPEWCFQVSQALTLGVLRQHPPFHVCFLTYKMGTIMTLALLGLNEIISTKYWESAWPKTKTFNKDLQLSLCQWPALITRDQLTGPGLFKTFCFFFISVPSAHKQHFCSGHSFSWGNNSMIISSTHMVEIKSNKETLPGEAWMMTKTKWYVQTQQE